MEFRSKALAVAAPARISVPQHRSAAFRGSYSRKGVIEGVPYAAGWPHPTSWWAGGFSWPSSSGGTIGVFGLGGRVSTVYSLRKHIASCRHVACRWVSFCRCGTSDQAVRVLNCLQRVNSWTLHAICLVFFEFSSHYVRRAVCP